MFLAMMWIFTDTTLDQHVGICAGLNIAVWRAIGIAIHTVFDLHVFYALDNGVVTSAPVV